MPTPSRRRLAHDIHTHLRALAQVSVWLGDVPPETDLPRITGTDRVAPYIVIWPPVGTPTGDGDLAGCGGDLTGRWRVTCVAAYVPDLLHLIDRVEAHLAQWRPPLADQPGIAATRLLPDPGWSVDVLTDKTVTPHRPYAPLAYLLTATN